MQWDNFMRIPPESGSPFHNSLTFGKEIETFDKSDANSYLQRMTTPQRPLIGTDLLAEIARLRRERNAVILAHYYQKPEIQDLADFVGDSLDLSRKAAQTDADVIAFCGVRFMAETAKILSPEKTVILPDMDAGCSLEDSCPPDQFAAFRAAHPDHIALTYINCSAAVKALSDIIVTSSSAGVILDQIPKDQKIIFGPDRHLGGYLARKTGRDMLLWPGVCIVHQAFSETELLKLKAEHPGAPVAAHPECPPHIVDHADLVGSTKAILDFALSSPADTILVATEPHIIHQMQKAAPNKTFIGVPGGDGNCNCNMCPYMALNTLEKLYVALRDLAPRIELSAEVMAQARVPLERMLEMAGGTVGKGDVGKPILPLVDRPEDLNPALSGD
jgi:quinolinate synthase